MNEHIKPQDGIVFDLRLGAHSGINYSAEDFSLFLKINALFCRSLVVTNTDLNNNSSFHEPSVLEELSRAIEIGFIRRATRVEANGHVWTQQQTLNQLNKNNEQRASKIPTDYVDGLDRKLEAVEKSYQPLTWSAEEISNIFSSRLLHQLSVDRQEPRSEETKKLIAKLSEYIYQCQSNGITVSAAEIEKSFFKDVHEDPEAMSLWEEVKICYNGNVEKAFDRKVITAMTQEMAENRYLPSYNNLDLLSKGKIVPASNVEEVIAVRLNIADKDFNWLLDISKVSCLSLDEIIELRENADPEPYFDARYTLLLSENTHELGLKRNNYWDRLARAGIAVQDQKRRELMRSLIESEAEAEWQSTVIAFAENLLGNIPGVGMILLAREPFKLARSWKRLNALKHGKIEDSDKAKLLSMYELYQQIPNFEIIRPL
jgi:hypothetical protein